jgi:hypothetical protein
MIDNYLVVMTVADSALLATLARVAQSLSTPTRSGKMRLIQLEANDESVRRGGSKLFLQPSRLSFIQS